MRSPEFLRYTGMAAQMAITILVFVFIGQWLDKRYPTESHVWTLIFSLAGVSVAMYSVIKSLMKK